MGFNVEMTGRSDYSKKVKMAVVGMAGAGKTLFSSTAPQPLYIFFREQPRIMSIANRAMPHIKVLPEFDNGRLIKPVEDIMLEILEYLKGDGAELYETLVIDTGDELQKALKEGKKARNRGKWGISDWGWLGDEYHTVVNAFIDLPMNVIVTYHLKNVQEGEDGSTFKEIALQGAAKDDTPGWFDIVGVLDTYENVDDKGIVTSSRGLLTQPTSKYGWVKDHSGQLPAVFEISDRFVGDFERMREVVYGEASEFENEHQVLSVVEQELPAKPDIEPHIGIPTPEEVESKKEEQSSPPTVEPVSIETTEPEKVDEPSQEATVDEAVTNLEDILDVEDVTKTPPAKPKPKPKEAAKEKSFFEEPEKESKEAEEETEEEAPVYPKCEVCGEIPVTEKVSEDGEIVTGDDGEPVMVVDNTLIDLSKVRFRKVLCQTHLLEARQKV